MGESQSQYGSQRIVKQLRKLYHWVIGWADHKYGLYALGVLAFVESSVFPIPPDLLLIAMAFGKPKKAFSFALICTLASVLGGALGYGLGMSMWGILDRFFLGTIFSPAVFERVRILYQDNAFLAVFSAGFTPIPYKVFTIAAGVFDVDFWEFMVASVFGRGGRFFLVSGVIYVLGDRAKDFVEKYFEWATIGISVALVGGFLLLKWVL
jgi:membrane protein YqaA with SNARE-associated domain